MISAFNSFAVRYPTATSAIHTFLATFLVTIIALVSAIPADAILSPHTWTTSAIAGILVAGVRAAIKAISPLNA
jgi:hypothetical protein